MSIKGETVQTHVNIALIYTERHNILDINYENLCHV